MKTYVPRVSVYFTDRGMRTLTVAQAADIASDANVVVILGAMRPGYLGREVVTADDLHRWEHEDDLRGTVGRRPLRSGRLMIPADLNPDHMSDAQVAEFLAALRRLFPDEALAADVELWEQEVGA